MIFAKLHLYYSTQAPTCKGCFTFFLCVFLPEDILFYSRFRRLIRFTRIAPFFTRIFTFYVSLYTTMIFGSFTVDFSSGSLVPSSPQKARARMAFSTVRFSLVSQLSDRRVVASVKLLGRHPIGGMGTCISEGINGARVLHLYLSTSILPHGDVNVNSYQQLMTLDLADYDAVCIGNGEKTIWQREEKIPAASQAGSAKRRFLLLLRKWRPI